MEAVAVRPATVNGRRASLASLRVSAYLARVLAGIGGLVSKPHRHSDDRRAGELLRHIESLASLGIVSNR